MIVTPPSIRCDVCGHSMEKLNDRLACMYCEGFYSYDIAKDWMDFILDNAEITEKEKKDEE